MYSYVALKGLQREYNTSRLVATLGCAGAHHKLPLVAHPQGSVRAMPIRSGRASPESQTFRNACRLGDFEDVRELFTLERAHMMDSDGRQAMNAAVLYGALEVAKWLHENGVGLDHTIHSGETLMHDACELGKLDTIRWLSSQGVPLDTPDIKGRQPKHRACFKGHVHVLEYFREQGVPFGSELERVFRDALMGGHLETRSNSDTDHVPPLRHPP
eukprot:CAMPEP_0119375742 /NCGR_PEP_ID=MMETSP1334-20130426/36588_1 /TAXON_ID=127549 /ORGANISM="Calcidiscus leptoporus, Strain RCC1130" /LENGTH=214 /DNA_ID=CAMNT_0007394123 /DNA_START=27 /DNA_END=668 /DNA_ORIENTATION=-